MVSSRRMCSRRPSPRAHAERPTQVVNGPELTVNAPLLEAVRAVHETCFPDEVPRHVPFGRGQTLTAHGGRTETAEGFLDRVTWTAELPATVWYLLWRSTSTSTSTSGTCPRLFHECRELNLLETAVRRSSPGIPTRRYLL
jgi:hypothetical protein